MEQHMLVLWCISLMAVSGQCSNASRVPDVADEDYNDNHDDDGDGDNTWESTVTTGQGGGVLQPYNRHLSAHSLPLQQWSKLPYGRYLRNQTLHLSPNVAEISARPLTFLP